MTVDATLAAALQPVQEALRRAAQSDVDSWRNKTEREVTAVLAQARDQAGQILAEAAAQGLADARQALRTHRTEAARAARGAVLAAHRQVYEALRAAAGPAASALRSDVDYPAIRDRMARHLHRLLGPSVDIRDAPDGGLIGTATGRRVDLTLNGFADRAVDAVASETGEQP